MRNRSPLAAALLLASLGFGPVSLLAQPPESGGANGAPEQDDPNARRRAMYEWYNDTAGRGLGNGNASDTGNENANPIANARAAVPFSREYMRYLNDAAERERGRWADLMPTPESSQSVGSPESTISAAAAATGTTWVEIGPDKANTITNGTTLSNISDSGRVRSIVPHPTDPNTLYVAFSGGGVWKTTNATVAVPTWAPLTETLGSLSVGSLAMDVANPNTLYLGLGDPFDGTGLGVYKTTDGGSSWAGPVYPGNSTQIPQMLVAPTNSSIVLAATDAGLYRSENGGASFSKITLATGQAGDPYVWSLAATGGNGMVLSLEAAPAATSGTTDGQIWRSTDNGATWTKSTGVTKTGGVGRITVAAGAAAGTNGATTVVYALAAKPLATAIADLADVFKSTNGGTSFTALSANTKRYTNANTESRNYSEILRGQGWYNHMIIVSPTNSNTVYTGGALLTARTTDGFSKITQTSNWLAQFSLGYLHADMHAAAFSGSTLYVGSDGGIFRSTNPTATTPAWTNMNEGITTHLLYSVGSSTNNPSAVIGGLQDNGTRVRVGATQVYNQPVGGDGFGSDINAANAQQMLGSLYYTRIQKSTNGGSSFVQSCSGLTGCGSSSAAPFLTQIEPWTGDATGNTVFTHTNTAVFKSTNYATSWTALGTTGLTNTTASPLYLRNVGVFKGNANRVGVVANGGRVFLTSNGSSWTQAGTLPNNGFSLSSIHFSPADASGNTIYVTSVAPSAANSHIWKSTNGGSSWSSLDTATSGLPVGIPINMVTGDPGDSTGNTLYAATHLGVYRSTDGGTNWVRFGTGMPLVNVTDVYVASNSSLVRAATFGRGVWELQP